MSGRRDGPVIAPASGGDADLHEPPRRHRNSPWPRSRHRAVARLNRRVARNAKTTVSPIAHAVAIHRSEPGSLPLYSACRVVHDGEGVRFGNRLQPAGHAVGVYERRRHERQREHPDEAGRVRGFDRLHGKPDPRLDPTERVAEPEEQQRGECRFGRRPLDVEHNHQCDRANITMNVMTLRNTSEIVRPISTAAGSRR